MQVDESSQVQIHQLEARELDQIENLLADRQLAQAAGLKLSEHPAARRWAIQNWLNQQVLWGIFKGKQLIGLIALFLINTGRELGYLLERPWWNQGIMTKAVQQVLGHYANQLIVAYTRDDNLASQAVLQANGFHLIAKQAGIIKWSTCKM
ncbi:GNAT family N-acetyltransferase [Limosilactobacillus gastricus]|uniref:GNAT family N-acetyltransferase n=1 Tax=Limosilactobacillus gastricus TaxID=227942 RepID=UPI00031243B5|nr:GNAT family N-acetyltransferase [Limosilactobacillus gastricus]